MGDFVRSEDVRLPLSKGRWIEVKKRLNAGETRKMFTRVIKDMKAGDVPQLDPDFVGLTKLIAYVTGWSFTDDDGKPVRFTTSAIDNLDPDLYSEMIAAVDAHIEAQERERTTEKNERDGGNASLAISSSVV